MVFSLKTTVRILALVSGVACVFTQAEASWSKGDVKTDPFYGRLAVFGGGDIGYHVISEDQANELSKQGYQADVDGFASFSWQHLTLQGGAGWLYQWSKGTASAGSVLRDKVTVKAGFGELTGRYRLTPLWELGLKNRILFGTDTRLATSAGSNDRPNWLVGLEGVYRIPSEIPIQLSAAFLTDTTSSNVQLFQILFGIHIGYPIWNFAKAPPPPEPEPTPEPIELPEEEPAEPVPPELNVIVNLPPEPTRTYTLGELQNIYFEFNRAELRPGSKEMILSLGRFLAENTSKWKKLRVEGHADRRGTHEYNMKLSQRRADTVRSVLVSQGAPADSVEAIGFGFTRPKEEGTTEEVYRKNRRVEFVFEGIDEENFEAFDQFFRDLNREF